MSPEFDDSALKAHLSALPEEERKRIMGILSQIDNKRIPQGNMFTVGKYSDAIKLAEDIIELAKKDNIQYIIDEQLVFIEECKRMQGVKERMDVVKKECEVLTKNYDTMIAEDKIVEAHELVNKFQDKFGDFLVNNPILSVKTFLAKDRSAWSKFTEKQEVIMSELKSLERQFNSLIENGDLGMAEKILEDAKKHVPQVKIKDLKGTWDGLESTLSNLRNKNILIEKVKNTVKNSLDLINNASYDAALSDLDSILKEIKGKALEEYEKKIQETKSEITVSKAKHDQLMAEISDNEKSFEENKQAGKLLTARSYCETIIQLATSVKISEIVEKYQGILELLKSQIDAEKEQAEKERELLIQKSEELKNVIEIEEGVLPLIEEFSARDLFGDISGDLNEMLEKIGGLLTEHRVEVKKEITIKVTLKSASGEIIEHEKNIQVVQSEDTDKDTILYVESGLQNPFDDVIEEAIISDILPYNFEVMSVELNGELVKELPEKTLKKEGMELNWKLQNISAKENVRINYNLRRRISRTIIFILKGNVKIIKTHSKITGLALEGLYEAKLPFTNSFGSPIDGVVVEDIIPLYYVNLILKPEKLLPNKNPSPEIGELVKWNVGKMEVLTLDYHYKLLELYKTEQLKIEFNELNKKAMNALNEGKIVQALENFTKIKEEINLFMV